MFSSILVNGTTAADGYNFVVLLYPNKFSKTKPFFILIKVCHIKDCILSCCRMSRQLHYQLLPPIARFFVKILVSFLLVLAKEFLMFRESWHNRSVVIVLSVTTVEFYLSYFTQFPTSSFRPLLVISFSIFTILEKWHQPTQKKRVFFTFLQGLLSKNSLFKIMKQLFVFSVKRNERHTISLFYVSFCKMRIFSSLNVLFLLKYVL